MPRGAEHTMMNLRLIMLLLAFVGQAPLTLASDDTAAGTAVDPAFDRAAAATREQLDEAIRELNEVRETILAEKLPLNKKLSELEAELLAARQAFQETTRTLDSRTLDLSNLKTEIKAREDESVYLSNLLGEYVRNFESDLHIVELQRYRDPLDAARLAPENANLTPEQVYDLQANLLKVSFERLDNLLGGDVFTGSAVDGDGTVRLGEFALIGPAAYFRSSDGSLVGTAEQRLGSLEPAVVPFKNPADTVTAQKLFSGTEGVFPFDPTLGNAHIMDATEETLIEHAMKGGPVMVPIIAMAAAAFLVALYKWLAMFFVRKPSQARIRELLDAVARGDRDATVNAARKIGGPTGRMLATGVEHIQEPRDLIEEVMYEHVLATRLQVNRWLPFIAISAAAAPLLGLLGTVTGIINTFQLITVFGTGDVKTLSGGISEALITTEFGLIIAIPSLMLHAFLSRKARGITDQMEKSAVAFANQVAKSPFQRTADTQPQTDAVAVPGTVDSLVSSLKDKLEGDSRINGDDREAIGSALRQLNSSVADLIRAVYEATTVELKPAAVTAGGPPAVDNADAGETKPDAGSKARPQPPAESN